MSSTYEVWMTDDYGRRVVLIDEFSSLSYSKTTQGLGTIQIELPFRAWLKKFPAVFKVDNRLDVWRSPMSGVPARREGSFLLRRYQVYQRESDAMEMIVLYGRSPLDILKRQCWETDGSQTNETDDIMKNIVRTMYVTTPSALSTAPTVLNSGVYTYTGEFVVDEDSSDGPVQTGSFYLRNIFDILHDLRVSCWVLNKVSSSNKKIYFDVVEDESLVSGGFGYRFRTYPDLRGKDRTSGILFTPENGNMQGPTYYEDYQDEITANYQYDSPGSVFANAQSDDQYLSRWNFIKKDSTTSQTLASAALLDAYAELKKNGADIGINATFISTPGAKNQPRSLYGIDWDLGDLLPVKFANKTLSAEVAIVYVSTNETGAEKITGKNLIGTNQ